MLLAVILVLIVLILVLVAVLVLITVLVVVLITVLVIHDSSSKICTCGIAASIVCPVFQLLSFGRKRKLARRPAVMATVIPPAQAFSPPVKIPRKPSLCTASRTPLARL